MNKGIDGTRQQQTETAGTPLAKPEVTGSIPVRSIGHVGRRRAVHVARSVEASAGSCVYSSPTAAIAKPAS